MANKTILISRTDSIGDVVLTLPMAGVIKENLPDCKIIFLGKTYTKPVVSLSKYVDEFLNWDELQNSNNPIERLKNLNIDTVIHVFPNKAFAKMAKSARVEERIGTFGRFYHHFTCNQKVRFSRKKSDLHEAQLNLKLLAPLGISKSLSKEELADYYGFGVKTTLPEKWKEALSKDKFNLILHPKSQGSAKEWGLEKFNELIELLPEEKFQIFISGTEAEKKLIDNQLNFQKSNVVSLLGQMSLDEFIAFISEADGLVAASTGPLHIASALGKKAVGLFSPLRPIHPGRWQPLGKKATAVVFDENCSKCNAGEISCNCISQISPQKVVEILLK